MRVDTARSKFVARVTVTTRVHLKQRTTTGPGYRLRVEETLAGEGPPPEFVLWAPQDAPELATGRTLVVFAGDDRAGRTDAVTVDGVEVTVFHIAVPGGVLESANGQVARVCRNETSEFATDDVLDGR